MRRFCTTARQFVEVSLKQGVLRGKKEVPPNGAPPFEAFLGVPYAKPPVGALRFKSAEPPEPWEGVRQADSYGALSIQIDFTTRKFTGDEDCLYLNVYRPLESVSMSGDPLPVMVFFPYGMWNLCNPSQMEYGPEFLVSKNVIVITVNYRVGALGFMSLNSPALPGNYGVRDCIAALRWVQGNAAAFGGDPGNVTAYGVCVGSVMVQSLLFSPAAKGLFQRAICQSGGVCNSWLAFTPGSRARKHGLKLGKLLGCDATNDEELVDFMRKVPAREIFTKTAEVLHPDETCFRRVKVAFSTSRDDGAAGCEEGQIMPDHPLNLLNEDRFYPVPLLSGYVASEGEMFAVHDINWWTEAHFANYKKYELEAVIEELIPDDFGERGAPERRIVADEVRRHYFDGRKLTVERFRNFQSDIMAMFGAFQSLRWLSLHPNNVPTYMYVFDVSGKWNRFNNHFRELKEALNMTDFDKLRMPIHCDDLGYVFGSRRPAPVNEPLEHDSMEATTARRMQALFTNFAKCGNPNQPSDPDLGNVQWNPLPNRFGVPYDQLVIRENLSIQNNYRKADLDFLEKLYENYFKFASPLKSSARTK